MNPIETAHKNLQHLLRNGRIILNGAALTATEMMQMLQDEQRLYEQAKELMESKSTDKPSAEKEG